MNTLAALFEEQKYELIEYYNGTKFRFIFYAYTCELKAWRTSYIVKRD